MRILFVSYRLSGGGAERVISVLSNQLIKSGHDVGVLLYKRTSEEYLLSGSVSILELEKLYSEKTGNPISRKLSRISGIRKLVCEYKPDVIIPFLDSMVIETYFATRGMNIPIVATVRNNPEKSKKIDKLLRNYVFKRCSSVFLQTEEQGRYFSDKIRKKTFVVPNPVNEHMLEVGRARVSHASIKSIVTCGRLEKQKNHELLIQAMLSVHRIYPDVYLSIYGEGSERDELQQLINDNNAAEYIYLMGRTNCIAEVLSDADLFVLSSDFEGMPNALMEAMACGVPCISTDCPTGPRELIGDDERGVLVPVGDKGKMVDAICGMISGVDKASKLGVAAHIYLETFFSPCKIANRFLSEIGKGWQKYVC